MIAKISIDSYSEILMQLAILKQLDEKTVLQNLIEAWEDAQDIKAAEDGWQDYLDHKEECKTLEDLRQEMEF